MTDVASTENSYKNHRERCICMACSIVAVAKEAAEVIDRLENEREHLRKERDEARRELCEFAVGWQRAGMRVQHPQQYAQERGWDCFKEDDK
jgi:prefoldin subunit 5